MTWLALAYLLSVGSLDYSGIMVSPNGSTNYQTPANTYQTTLGAEAQLFNNHIFAGGTVQTWESSLGTGLFSPAESLYTFNAGLRFKGFELGYRHECDHITLSDFNAKLQGFAGNRTEVYFSYIGHVKVF